MKERDISDGWKSIPGHCPYCHGPLQMTSLDMATGKAGEHAPTRGMFAMCHHCGKVSRVIADAKLEKIPPQEMLVLLTGPHRKELIAAHVLIDMIRVAQAIDP